MKPKVYADFHNADAQGRLRLTCAGTLEDLAQQKIELREGLRLTVYSDDADEHGEPGELVADAIVTYSVSDRRWVAAIEPSTIRHASDTKQAT